MSYFKVCFFQPHKFWCPQILLDLLCINFAFPFTLLLLSAVISVDVEGNADQANWLCLWWPLLALPSLATGQKAKSDCDPFLILVLLSSVKSRSALWPCLCLIKGVQQLLFKIFRISDLVCLQQLVLKLCFKYNIPTGLWPFRLLNAVELLW